MNEGQYLELVNQLKEKYDMITGKLDRIEAMDMTIKKDIMSSYGIVRMLDHLVSNSHVPYDNEIIVIIEVLRGMMSEMINRHIFDIDET